MKVIEEMTSEELVNILMEEAFKHGAYGFEMKREKAIKAEILKRIARYNQIVHGCNIMKQPESAEELMRDLMTWSGMEPWE